MSEGSWIQPAHASTPPAAPPPAAPSPAVPPKDAPPKDAPAHPVAHQTVTIVNNLGLHLRPAEKFVTLARRFQAEIQVHYKGRELNGGSILDLIGIAAEKGSRLELVACGPEAKNALDALARLVTEHFYEGPDGTPLPEPEDLFPPPPHTPPLQHQPDPHASSSHEIPPGPVPDPAKHPCSHDKS